MTSQEQTPDTTEVIAAEASADGTAAKRASFFARHKIAAIVSASALVLMLAGGGLVAYSLNADAVSPLLAATGLATDEDAEPGKLDSKLVKAEDKVADEVPDGAEVIEDANAPEGTTAVRDASGNVTYVATDKVNAAVSAGSAKPSASSGNSTSSGGSAPAPAPSKPAAPVHEHSFVATTVVDVPEKPITRWTTNALCGVCWYYEKNSTMTVCPNCGASGMDIGYTHTTDTIGYEPAVTHTEYVCSCGARQ